MLNFNGQPWSVPHSKIKWHGLNHGQIPDVQTFKSTHLWMMNMAKPWSTMVDHGLAMFWSWLNHGWSWSGYIRQPWSDHGNHGQFHIQKSNDHGQSWSNTWCADIQINTPAGWTWPNYGQPWLTMVWQCFDHGWTMVAWPWSGYIRQPWADHGQPWSVPHSKIKWPWSIMVKYLVCRHPNQHTWGMIVAEPWSAMVGHGLAMFWPWSGYIRQPWSDHGQFHIQKSNDLMINHGQIPDVQTFKLICLWGMNMAEPWLTMVWQCFDHGQVNSGNHGQFHIQKSNDLMVSRGLKYLMCRHSN